MKVLESPTEMGRPWRRGGADGAGLEDWNQPRSMGQFGQKGSDHGEAGSDKDYFFVFQYFRTRHNYDFLGGVIR